MSSSWVPSACRSERLFRYRKRDSILTLPSWLAWAATISVKRKPRSHAVLGFGFDPKLVRLRVRTTTRSGTLGRGPRLRVEHVESPYLPAAASRPRMGSGCRRAGRPPALIFCAEGDLFLALGIPPFWKGIPGFGSCGCPRSGAAGAPVESSVFPEPVKQPPALRSQCFSRQPVVRQILPKGHW